MFSGKRIARSWYRSGDGTVLHADSNGSDTILRKRSSDPMREWGEEERARKFAPDGWPSKRMTHRHMGRHFKILYSYSVNFPPSRQEPCHRRGGFRLPSSMDLMNGPPHTPVFWRGSGGPGWVPILRRERR